MNGTDKIKTELKEKLPKKRGLSGAKLCAVIFAALFAAALCVAALCAADILLVQNISVLTRALIGNEYITGVLGQLKGAQIEPPLIIIALFSAAAGGIGALFVHKKNVAVRIITLFAAVLLFIAASAVSLYFTKVNGIEIRIAVITVGNILKSGLL